MRLHDTCDVCSYFVRMVSMVQLVYTMCGVRDECLLYGVRSVSPSQPPPSVFPPVNQYFRNQTGVRKRGLKVVVFSAWATPSGSPTEECAKSFKCWHFDSRLEVNVHRSLWPLHPTKWG